MTPWDDLVQRIEKLEKQWDTQAKINNEFAIVFKKLSKQTDKNIKTLQAIITALEELGKQVELLEQKYDEDVQTLIKAIEFLQKGKV